MHILLYVPDNQVTNNFVPQLWPFVLQRLTPKEHRVSIIDGNVRHLSARELGRLHRSERCKPGGHGLHDPYGPEGLSHGGAAIRRETSVPIVMGGPHVTEVPNEPLGLTGHPQYADAVWCWGKRTIPGLGWCRMRPPERCSRSTSPPSSTGRMSSRASRTIRR